MYNPNEPFDIKFSGNFNPDWHKVPQTKKPNFMKTLPSAESDSDLGRFIREGLGISYDDMQYSEHLKDNLSDLISDEDVDYCRSAAFYLTVKTLVPGEDDEYVPGPDHSIRIKGWAMPFQLMESFSGCYSYKYLKEMRDELLALDKDLDDYAIVVPGEMSNKLLNIFGHVISSHKEYHDKWGIRGRGNVELYSMAKVMKSIAISDSYKIVEKSCDGFYRDCRIDNIMKKCLPTMFIVTPIENVFHPENATKLSYFSKVELDMPPILEDLLS